MRTPLLTYCFLLLLLCYCPWVNAQDSVGYNKKGSFKVKQAATELQEALSSDNEEQTAKSYETLSAELAGKGDYVRAESYLKKALDIYNKLSKKKQAAAASRSLAKLQESQNKIAPAIQNYEWAANSTQDRTLMRANTNDANRLRYSDPKQQADYALSNASIFEKQGKKEEATDAYKQAAESQIQQNKPLDAVATYQKALKAADKQEDVNNINKEIAKVLASDNQVSKAIDINEKILNQARKKKDVDLQVEQLQELAHLYARTNQDSIKEALLREAYELALKDGNTLKAKASLMQLVQYYQSRNDYQRSAATSEAFLNQLDSLVKKDSSLADSRIFEVTEGRIRELEQEKKLQQELINKKNRFNYFLIGSVGLMLLLLLLIIRSLKAIKIKNKKIALQALRREMNPHFIFNSLNSVNQYIAENNELEANKYLTSYSGLMRNIMEHSNKDFVPLQVEIEQLKKYLDLEYRRFRDQFDYTIDIDEQLDTELSMVPNMLIQPHLENAIWHGLRYKEGKGLLLLQFRKEGQDLLVTVTDDGIGLSRSKALKTVNQKAHQSRGILNTEERIGLLNDLYHIRIAMHMKERPAQSGTGTEVTLRLPLSVKK